jgi:DNA polymerase I-like protein with 3'-5' exonuclease and polymerase domains
MKAYYQSGYVTTLNGRKHRYPLTRNQAINHPVQGTACEIVCDSMNRLSQLAKDKDEWHLHPRLNIHDDLTMIVPDNDDILETSIRRIYGVMLTPNCPGINVPFSVSCSVGQNWFEMVEIGKFWSHRDL